MGDNSKHNYWRMVFAPTTLLSALLAASYSLITAIVRDVHRGYVESILLYVIPIPIMLFGTVLGAFVRIAFSKDTVEKRDISFHLSTLMALMFGAGVMLWLNIRNRAGWPFDVFTTEIHVWKGGKEVIESVDWVSQIAITLNVGITYLILIGIYYVCERRIRKQAEKAQSISEG